MMNSLDNYVKLKGELNRIFVEGFDLEEDEFLSTLLSSAKTSKCALGLARKLKEDGNTLFKQEEFDDALEQYGYAGFLLACCDFERDEDRIASFDLAISVLLNTTACLSRKKEFVQVGQLCSIVLDFKPNSVKALFRRALAALELGETKWAYWDLLIAMEVEPKNPEVIKKFAEVKCILDKENLANHAQDITPIGLGIGLPSPKGNESKCLDKESNKNQCEEHDMDSTTIKRKGDEWEIDMSSNVKKEKLDICDNEDMNERAKDSSALQEGMEVKKKKVKEGNVSDSSSKISIQAESMYRFDNRRRPGSSISISGRDYDLLKKGKTIKFFNHKCGTMMTIQVKDPKGDIRKKDEFPSDEVNMVCQDYQKEDEVEIETFAGEMKTTNLDGMTNNNTRDEGELSATPRKQEEPDSKVFPSKSEQSTFQFSANSSKEGRDNLVTRVKQKAFQRKLQDPGSKKRISATTPSSSLCFVGFCRYHAGTKRKLCSFQDSVQRPRKKYSIECGHSVNLDCFSCSSLKTCSSDLFYGRYAVASHAMVSDHENG